MRWWLRLLADEAGVTTVETALILVLVVVASFLSFQTFGQIVREQVHAVGSPLVPGA